MWVHRKNPDPNIDLYLIKGPNLITIIRTISIKPSFNNNLAYFNVMHIEKLRRREFRKLQATYDVSMIAS